MPFALPAGHRCEADRGAKATGAFDAPGRGEDDGAAGRHDGVLAGDQGLRAQVQGRAQAEREPDDYHPDGEQAQEIPPEGPAAQHHGLLGVPVVRNEVDGILNCRPVIWHLADPLMGSQGCQ